MQPMQQVMSEAESILATEPRVGFNIGQAKKELIKVNVCKLTANLCDEFIADLSIDNRCSRVCAVVFVNRK